METKDIGKHILYSDGRIWSKRRKLFVKLGCDKGGYVLVVINRKGTRMHRLIAEHFIPNPNKLPQVNHINGDKSDNRKENLEWCNAKHNMKHALELDLLKKGSQLANSKLTEQQAREIKYDHQNLSQREIAKIYGISRRNVQWIRNGKSWKHV